MHHKPTRRRGIWLIIVALFILAAVGAALWLRLNYKSVIRQKLPELSAKATDSVYHIGAGDFNIDLPGRSITIHNLQLRPDSGHLAKLRLDYRLPPLIYNIRIPLMKISGINWTRLAADKVLECDSIRISNPDVHITRIATERPDKRPEQKAPPKFESILAKVVFADNPNITFTDSTAERPTSFVAKGGAILLSDWEFDLQKPMDSSELFYAKRTLMRFESFAVHSAASFYNVRSGAVEFNNGDHYASVADVQVLPALSRAEFYRRTGYQKEIYTLRIGSFRLDGFDWKKLAYGGALFAERGSLRDADIDIFMSRLPPPNPYSKNGKFPHQLWMKLKPRVNIRRIDVQNTSFSYTEKNQKTKQEGTVAMKSIRGSVHNLTNIPAQLRRNRICTVALTSNFKGIPIETTFQFMLGSRNGAFSVSGHSGTMDGTRLNDIVRPLALIEFRSLKLNGLKFRIQGNEAGAKGTMTMLYSDLAVNMLKPKDEDLNKADVMSFLANHLLTHDKNGGANPRVVHPEVSRDDKKSFFNLIWKTIFTGALQTVSRDIVKVDKVVNKRSEKEHAERLENEPPTPKGGKKKGKQ
jgi:hypothetical protein